MAPSTALKAQPSREELAAIAEARLSQTKAADQDDSVKHGLALASKRVEFERMVERGLIGPNGYADAEKVISTLIRIASGIIDDPTATAKRTIKASSKVLKNNVLDIKGGQDFLVAIGFRTATVDFVQTWTFALPDPSSPAQLTRLEVLSLARDVLALKEVETRARAEKAKGGGAQSKKAEEKQRQEEALRGIEHDRLKVAERVAREANARARLAAAAAAAGPPHSAPTPASALASERSVPAVQSEDDDSEEEAGHEDEGDDDGEDGSMDWGHGEKLGS